MAFVAGVYQDGTDILFEILDEVSRKPGCFRRANSRYQRDDAQNGKGKNTLHLIVIRHLSWFYQPGRVDVEGINRF
jgi:hypothetical protein